MPRLSSKSGFPTGLLTGFVNLVRKIPAETPSDYLVFCAEGKEKSFRHALFGEYKANRLAAPEELTRQIPVALEWIEKMGFALEYKNGFEADDMIASIAHHAKHNNMLVRIVSSDKDMYQLIDKTVMIYDPVKQKNIDRNGCYEKFGVYPEQFIEFQAIVGDSSDNVPGVKGIGEKGALKLISEFGTLENIYENIDKIGGRTQQLLAESKEMAFLSRKLVSLSTDALNNMDLTKYTIPDDPISKITQELIDLDMKTVVKRTEKPVQYSLIDDHENGQNSTAQVSAKNGNDTPYNAVLITDENELLKIIDDIPSGVIVAFDTETTDLDVRNAKIVGFSFAYDEGQGYYAAIGHNYLGAPQQISAQAAKTAITKLFAKSKIIGHNIKFDLHILKHTLGLENLTIFCDTILIAWLINPDTPIKLDSLASGWLDHENIAFKTVTNKLNNFSEVELSAAAQYAAEDAVMTLRLYPKLLEKLTQQDEKLVELLFNIEMPFLDVLKTIEDNGLMIDPPFFEQLQLYMHGELAKLTETIYKLAGEHFNINSTQQLGVILFERLKLPTARKTKNGYSTDEAVLNSLAEKHPIANELLNYREISKLKSTYIEPLLEISKKSRRVHTHLSQTGTATGRLSSSEPNLQNIPTRTALGKQIRRGFTAKEGCVLLSPDYSQIELRLLAHFSGDQTLINAFKSGRDIHAETANILFGSSDSDKRALAKGVNFGLLYGMGQRKLAADMGISSAEAKDVIDTYFTKFPPIKAYLESIKELAHTQGFVCTLLGRRRYFDFEHASNQYINMYEREAVNALFQGSAADLIKLAMLTLHKQFLSNSKVEMALQIHDELLFEIQNDAVQTASEVIKEAMQNAYALDVPLAVTINTASNWAELK